MRRISLLTSFFFLWFTSVGQTGSDLSKVLLSLTCSSEKIREDKEVKAFIAKGNSLLTVLADEFTNCTTSAVFSNCVKRKLTIGELAIIVADAIEIMPYFLLTGLQNCTLEKCPDNPNWVEYYLHFIEQRMTPARFQEKYREWLVSKDRRKIYK